MDAEQQMRSEIHEAVAEMVYVRDSRRTPSVGRRAQFRIGWEDAAVRDITYALTTLQRLTWRSAGYRLGKVFGNQPEYMEAAYDILAEHYIADAREPEPTRQSLSKQAFNKLDRMLGAFTRYRVESEERYLSDERTYKEELFADLAAAWDELYDDPARSRQMLLNIAKGENPETRRALDNLLGGRGFGIRDNFRAYLEDTEPEAYLAAMETLFDPTKAIAVRLRQFRDLVSGEYRRLHAEEKLHKRVKKPPRIPQSFVGILLASYDPDTYILYRNTEYSQTATWLGLQVPGSPEHAYTVFLDMARSILEYAQQRQAPVHDLLDVHNMIYVLWKYGEFAPATAPAAVPTAREDSPERIQQRAPDESIYEFIRNRSFTFPDWLVTSYVLSLATKPFVILSGISGTGKTKLALLLAEYMAAATGNAQTQVAVRPDWTDNSHLLGWYNAISERYETTPVLDTIRRAADAPTASPLHHLGRNEYRQGRALLFGFSQRPRPHPGKTQGRMNGCLLRRQRCLKSVFVPSV